MGEFKNRINVTINDQHYTIVGEDNPEHIRYVAHLVDERLKELASKSAGLDTTRKAILTAVNIMHEKVQVEEENDRLRQEINQYLQKATPNTIKANKLNSTSPIINFNVSAATKQVVVIISGH